MFLSQALFSHAEADRRRRRAFCAVRRPATRTEHRHQRFARLAACRAVSLNDTQAGGSRVALVALGAGCTRVALITLRTWCALRPLRSLRARLSLCPGHTLNALCTLRTRGSLRARLAFRSGIPAATGKRKGDTDDEYGNNSHDNPPMNHWSQAAREPYRDDAGAQRYIQARYRAAFGRDTISIILPSSSSEPLAFARS